MKSTLVIYWIATLLVSAFMAFAAYSYLTDPTMMATFSSLGYPSYFSKILATAKFLGIIALLVPSLPLLKEWAYAGFTFTFIGAFFSHLASGQGRQSLIPLVTLVVLAISYFLRPVSRDVPRHLTERETAAEPRRR